MAVTPKGRGPIHPQEIRTLARGVAHHLWHARNNPDLRRRAVRRWVTAAREIGRDVTCSNATVQAPAITPGAMPDIRLAWREMTEPGWQDWAVIEVVAQSQGAVVARSAVLYLDSYYWPALNGQHTSYPGHEAAAATMMHDQLRNLVTSLDYTAGWSDLQRQCRAELSRWLTELVEHDVAHEVAPALEPEAVHDPRITPVQLVWSADAA